MKSQAGITIGAGGVWPLDRHAGITVGSDREALALDHGGVLSVLFFRHRLGRIYDKEASLV